MIQDLFTTYFTINRATWTADEEGNAYSAESEVGTFYGHIQQVSPNKVASLGLTLTDPYSIWCPIDTQVKAGDTVVSVNGQFSVKAIQINNVGDNKHLQLVAQLDEVIGS